MGTASRSHARGAGARRGLPDAPLPGPTLTCPSAHLEKPLTFRVNLLLISLFSSCSSCSFRAARNREEAFGSGEQCRTQVYPLKVCGL